MGTILLVVLLVILIAFSIAILHGTNQISANSEVLTKLNREKVLLEHSLEQARTQARIVDAVRTLGYTAISDTTIVKLVHLVYTNSQRYGYDPLLVLAIIRVESVFDPHALGRFRDGTQSGAMGLMQLKEETAREVANALGMEFAGEADLLRPEINMLLGIGYLTRLISRFQSFKLGLLAYNQGPGTIRKSISDQTPLSIQYYEKVLRSYYRLRILVNTKHEPA